MIKYHNDIEQRSMDWNRIRYGRVGGSESEALLVKGKSAHGLGTGAISMLYDKVWEIKTSSPAKDVFVNDAMQRGIDLEGEAIYTYQNNHFQTVTLCGYVTNVDKKYAGYTPDGLISEDGLIEIKCPGSREYVRTGRSWCDYVVYNPDFESNSMVVQKVERDDDMIELLLDNYLVFENLMNQALNRLG